MEPTRIEIERRRGDTWPLVFVINSDRRPLNIAGWTNWRMAINPHRSPTDTSEQIAELAGELTTDGRDGRVSFPVPGSLPAGGHWYDVQGTDENGADITVAFGQIKIVQDITK